MLRIFHEARELDFEKLCAVYRESILQKADKTYPEEECAAALHRAEADFEAYIREVFFRLDGAFYSVWEEGGQYLSALRMEPHRDGYLLTSLETAPDHRRRGYAEKLILEVTAFVGKTVYAHVHKKNTASMALHHKCGFQQILDYAVFLDGTVSQRAWTLCWK